MEIRNNLLADIKKIYLRDLLGHYDKREAEQLLTILIEHFFGITRNELILNPGHRLSESELLKLHMAVKHLEQYRPVQYITGVVEFHGLKLKVGPDVLIPRPETEELVQLIADNEKGRGLIVLDVGTGSGCIAIGLSSLLNGAIVHASDISTSAVSMAGENAAANNKEVAFHVHDILNDRNPIYDKNGEKVLFDIVVGNPPYVTLEDKKKMHANVIGYEPHNALFVPEGDPLLFYGAILKLCEKNLKHGGRIYLEINEIFGDEMQVLLEKHGYLDIVLRKDLSGKNRFVSGARV